MIKDAAHTDGFAQLLQTQEHTPVPDFLEADIMSKIAAQAQKGRISISLQSVFILSSLAALYVVLHLVSVYYLPQQSIVQESKTMLVLLFWVKLCYDLNDVLPLIFQQFYLSRNRKTNQHKTAS